MFRLQRMRQLDLPTLKMQGHPCHVCIKQPDRWIFLPAPKARGRERGSQWHFSSHRRQNIFLKKEISVDRPNTTHKLVIMWNVTLRVCLNSGSLSFFSRAKVTSTTQCKRCSILNFDWVNLVFAALNLIFRGHEAGLLHAYWVIISCGLCFCTRCPWQDLISDAVRNKRWQAKHDS